ncbi:MAG: bifunctional folylpolyglutamate synthase/dihydrofolate synthase [Actinobacteria bacterium]|nr:bifunctional folylpolyglutamate synthase/dihydrofolate synthase [Actinomycetota bacterium]
MQYDEALAYLDGHINREARAGVYDDLSLDAMHELAGLWGDPHRAYRVIHITGTNGKGSTARMVTRLLLAHGLRVGTYTSPHVEEYTERLRLDDEPIAPEEFGRLIGELADVEPLLTHRPSHFECLTAIALSWFAQCAVDVAVVEVGVLGRYDATNIVDADVAVVTNIGSDHTDFGEAWRERIAREKAGIIKPSSTLVLGETDPELRPIFLAEGPVDAWIRGEDFDATGNRLAVGGRLCDLRTRYQHLEEVFVPLHGAHQGDNAVVALAAAEAFFGRAVAPDVAATAFATVEVAGRFEVLGRNPLVIIDGAHNLEGAVAAGAVFREGFAPAGRRILVVGMLVGRDHAAMLRAFGAAEFDLVVTCAPESPRALSAEELAAVATAEGCTAVPAADVETALDEALRGAGAEDLVFVSGSLYLVGSARRLLRRRLGRA